MTSNKINTPLYNHLFYLPTSALINDCDPMHIPWSWIKECSLIFYYLALQVCRRYKVASRCTCTTPWTPFPRQYRPATLSSKQSSSSLRLRPPRQAAANQLVKFEQRFPLPQKVHGWPRPLQTPDSQRYALYSANPQWHRLKQRKRGEFGWAMQPRKLTTVVGCRQTGGGREFQRLELTAGKYWSTVCGKIKK